MYNLNMTWRAFGAAAIALLFTTAVFAQQPGRIRGQIEKTDGSTLSLKTREGSMLDVKVADDARVAALDFYYGEFKALQSLSLEVREKQVTALIGPSGCGKTTFLRCFNRMHDLQIGTRYQGRITLQPDNVNLVGRDMQPIEARMRIGMVFQRPNPFPKSIFDNVAYGLRLRGTRKRSEIEESVEHALRSAALWEETKDRLHESALALSGGPHPRPLDTPLSRLPDQAVARFWRLRLGGDGVLRADWEGAGWSAGRNRGTSSWTFSADGRIERLILRFDPAVPRMVAA